MLQSNRYVELLNLIPKLSISLSERIGAVSIIAKSAPDPLLVGVIRSVFGVFCYRRLEVECFADHVDRVEELPAEELDELWDELTVLSYHNCSLVWVTTYVSI